MKLHIKILIALAFTAVVLLLMVSLNIELSFVEGVLVGFIATVSMLVTLESAELINNPGGR